MYPQQKHKDQITYQSCFAFMGIIRTYMRANGIRLPIIRDIVNISNIMNLQNRMAKSLRVYSFSSAA
jgi:hypothetical protein